MGSSNELMNDTAPCSGLPVSRAPVATFTCSYLRDDFPVKKESLILEEDNLNRI